jgi:hypothetical protein
LKTKQLLEKSVHLVKTGKRPKATAPSDLPEGVLIDREGNFVFPASPAARADILYAAERLRFDLQHRVEKLKKLEGELDEYFIETLPKSEASGIAGSVARVQIKTSIVPVVEDWEKFYAHVKRTGNFELLQRRLSTSAVEERWENKKQIPGVGTFQAKKVSVTKI